MTRFLIRISPVILTALLLSSGPSHAFDRLSPEANSRIKRLLEQPDRPTVTEFMHAVGELPSSNPFRFSAFREAGNVQSGAQWRQSFLAEAPAWIARLEKAFPGATWAPLGRDAVALGDMLDAFFISIGQPNRVSRLKASSGSFSGGDHDLLVKFLESAGLDLDHPERKPPFVVIDNTSYSGSSQSTRVMRAGYDEYTRRGGDPADLVQFFNLVSTAGANYGHKAVNAYLEMESFLKNAAHGISPQDRRPKPILSINPGGSSTAWGVLMYGVQWHDSFGRFAADSRGRVAGTPGALSARGERVGVLWEMYEFVKAVSDPAFRQQVAVEARNLDYTFEFQHDRYPGREAMPAPKPRKPTSLLRREWEEFYGRLPQKGDGQEEFLSKNAQSVANFLSGTQTPGTRAESSLLFFQFISRAHREGKIGDRDLRRLVGMGLAKGDPHSEYWIRGMRRILGGDGLLRGVLTEKKDSVLKAKDHYGDAVVNHYEVIEQRVLRVMRCDERLAG